MTGVAAILACCTTGSLQALENSFAQTILVANRPEYNPTAFVDPYLINAWGIALRPPGAGGHIWVSNATSATTTTYIGDVNGTPLYQDGLKFVGIDGPLVSLEGGVPFVTGQVYNAATDVAGQPTEFLVSGPAHDLRPATPLPLGITSGSAKFIFVTTDGTINAWRASTAVSMDSAVIVKDYSYAGADRIYTEDKLHAFTGVAITTSPFTSDSGGNKVADNRLFVTDFNNGVIRVLNNQWQDITDTVPFERPADLAADTNPYNIQYLGGKLYVTYAVLDTGSDEAAVDLGEPGSGRLVSYDTDGHILQEFNDAGSLTSPWGLALAPEGFGNVGGNLLVGNFADGTISAFDIETGEFVDNLRDANGEVLSVDGIWGITFGNGVSLGDANSLYFAAGPNGEQDGTFGKVTMTPSNVPEPSVYGLLAVSAIAGIWLSRKNRRVV